MYRFHISLHARPAIKPLDATAPIVLDGRAVRPLEFAPSDVTSPFAVTFDDAGERLALLPRMFFEPDGAFVWRGERDGRKWQVDGNLYDGGRRLQYVDLKGECPPGEFDQLLSALGWPAQAVIVQLTRHALFLDEQAFRVWALTADATYK